MEYFVVGVGLAAALFVIAASVWPRLVAGRVVGAVYRAALKAADQYGGLDWLRSAEGIAYRRMLVRRAYAALPSPIWVLHWKLLVSEELFCAWVERAFIAVVDLADDMAG